MMNKEEAQQMQALKDEVARLRSEVDGLREFVKSLYNMLESEQYESEDYLGTPDFGRVNT
ncbi:MAG: hypothetical protein MJZ38_04770 [archaeon]|nr:hypothetical protein [archaeon]